MFPTTAIVSPSSAVKANKRAPVAHGSESPVKSVFKSASKAQNEKGMSISAHSFNYTHLLGQGAFGKVFMARMKSGTTACAVKVVTKANPRSKAMGYGDILSEQHILKTLAGNPHFCELQASWHSALNFYFMMVRLSLISVVICD